MKSVGRLLVSCLFLVFSGCVTPSAHFAAARTDQGYAPRTAPEKIELFRSQLPSKKYIEIGAVNACCGDDTTAMIAMLRKKAAESGGDALIGLEIDARGGATASVIRFE